MARSWTSARCARGRGLDGDRATADEIAGTTAGPRASGRDLVDIARALASERGDDASADMLFWAEATAASIESHRRDLAGSPTTAAALERAPARSLERRRAAMALAMEFGFLLDHDRKLLSIGYRVADGTLDPSCYDLLASEARLASFMAIAKGDVPARHWFRLGRAVTPVGRGAALISWSGSMFEYLMPSLVMRAPAGSLLEQTSRLIVRRQIDYGAERGVPWGVSESAYNARDLELTYQYSNFGVPGLGLKRGLGENVVVAPYATALAAMVDPRPRRATSRGSPRSARAAATASTRRSTTRRPRLPEGAERRDRARLHGAPSGHDDRGASPTRCSTARCARGSTPSRSSRRPSCCCRSARRATWRSRVPGPRRSKAAADVRELEPPGGAAPHARRTTRRRDTHLLSNGRYAVMLTAAGSGYSRWRDLAVTRWREDATRDDWGTYVFLRDVDSGDGLVGRLPAERRRARQLRRRVHRGPRRVHRGATGRSRRRSR